jgi:hypothetical protein
LWANFSAFVAESHKQLQPHLQVLRLGAARLAQDDTSLGEGWIKKGNGILRFYDFALLPSLRVTFLWEGLDKRHATVTAGEVLEPLSDEISYDCYLFLLVVGERVG